jgi:hypothetical protein
LLCRRRLLYGFEPFQPTRRVGNRFRVETRNRERGWSWRCVEGCTGIHSSRWCGYWLCGGRHARGLCSCQRWGIPIVSFHRGRGHNILRAILLPRLLFRAAFVGIRVRVVGSRAIVPPRSSGWSRGLSGVVHVSLCILSVSLEVQMVRVVRMLRRGSARRDGSSASSMAMSLLGDVF